MQEQIEHYNPAKLRARASELRQCIAQIKGDPEMHGIEKSTLLKRHKATLQRIETKLQEV